MGHIGMMPHRGIRFVRISAFFDVDEPAQPGGEMPDDARSNTLPPPGDLRTIKGDRITRVAMATSSTGAVTRIFFITETGRKIPVDVC